MSTEQDHEATSETSSPKVGWREPHLLFPLLAGGLGIAAIALAYIVMRWGPSPIETTVVVVGGVILALAIAAYLGARQGHAAPFLAVAILLPYALTGVLAYASVQRAANEVEDLFAVDDLDAESVVEGEGEEPIESDEPSSPESEHSDDGPPTASLDGDSYSWQSGVEMTIAISRKEPWGSTDDYCGDGSCGVSNPDDLRVVFEYGVSVPDYITQPFDASSCPGQLHIASGNDDEAIIGVAGDYASYIEGKILPGQTKSGSEEYSIDRAALGEEFYIESSCGDPFYEADGPVYFTGVIDE